MIDIHNQVYTRLFDCLSDVCVVESEYTVTPSKYPCVTVDESSNRDVTWTFDSSEKKKFARVVYTIQIFSNKEGGRKQEARKIFGMVGDLMWDMGFSQTAFATRPQVYNSSTYCIAAQYTAIVREDGAIFRNATKGS